MPINIALIKYWGKLEPNYNLPLNSSLSLTLDINDIYTQTKIKFDKNLLKDMFIIKN